jgi:limonene-1,2-epoxide hydrolase
MGRTRIINPKLKAMSPKELLLQWVDAFNAADAEKLASFYHHDAVNDQVNNEPIVGKAAIKAMFEKEFSSAKMVCIVEQILQDGEWAILEWKDPLGLRGCGFFKVKDNLIILQRGYWDKLLFLQIHHLPLPKM